MIRPLDSIAKEIAMEAVAIAHAAGYVMKPERELFAVSDVSNLMDEVNYWLEKHMQPEST